MLERTESFLKHVSEQERERKQERERERGGQRVISLNRFFQ